MREEGEEARGDEARGWRTKESEAGRRRGTSLVCKGRAKRSAEGRKWQQCCEVRQGNDDKVQEGGTVSAVSAVEQVPVRGAGYLRRRVPVHASVKDTVGCACRVAQCLGQHGGGFSTSVRVHTGTGAWATCGAAGKEAQRHACSAQRQLCVIGSRYLYKAGYLEHLRSPSTLDLSFSPVPPSPARLTASFPPSSAPRRAPGPLRCAAPGPGNCQRATADRLVLAVWGQAPEAAAQGYRYLSAVTRRRTWPIPLQLVQAERAVIWQ